MTFLFGYVFGVELDLKRKQMNKGIKKLGKLYLRLVFPEDKEIKFKDSRLCKLCILFVSISLLILLAITLLFFN